MSALSGTRLRHRGFSLVELMVAMVLGLLLIGGSITIFSANVRSAELGQAVANLQSGARFALDTISSDLRSAGFRGCAAPDTSVLNIAVTGAPDGLFSDDIMSGSVVTASGWQPAPPDGYVPLVATAGSTPPGTPVLGTHALVVQYAAAPGVALSASMGTRSSNLDLNGSDSALLEDDFALVSDCESAEVFKISTLGGSANAQSVDPTERLSKRYLHRTGFPESTRVYPLVGAIYYVGDTGRANSAGDDIHALYLQSLPFDAASNPPIELLEGVDQLQLRFGVTDPADGSVVMHAPDAAALVRADVDVVKVGLLMSSVDPLLDSTLDRVFELAGSSVGPRTLTTPAAMPAYTADRRLRVPYDTTIRLRNRNL